MFSCVSLLSPSIRHWESLIPLHSVCCFLMLSIPNIEAVICSSLHLFVDMWVVSTVWLLGIQPLSTSWTYIFISLGPVTQIIFMALFTYQIKHTLTLASRNGSNDPSLLYSPFSQVSLRISVGPLWFLGSARAQTVFCPVEHLSPCIDSHPPFETPLKCLPFMNRPGLNHWKSSVTPRSFDPLCSALALCSICPIKSCEVITVKNAPIGREGLIQDGLFTLREKLKFNLKH